MNARKTLLVGFLLLTVKVFSQDPNFYIYLCFGQSNMEGQGTIEDQDKIVDDRFQVFQALDCSNLGRTKETWYTAVPPLCQCWSGLTPVDQFGKTMVANLPDSIRIGVINVAVGGCDIRLFDKDIYQDYDSTYTDSWFLDKITAYQGNPYQYLINLTKLAQENGVIKGILLHQGETNTGDNQWPSYMKKIYYDMMNDLSLDSDSIPLLAGEVVHADQGGSCASMNSIIAVLPDTLPNSYVISSSGCTDKDDNIHFNSAGYRELGRRYAIKMLSLMGYEINYGRGMQSVYLEPECATVGENWDIVPDDGASNEGYITAKTCMESISEPPTDNADVIYMPFSLDSTGYYSIYARIKCKSADDDALWVKLDEGSFELIDGLRTISWNWKHLINSDLVSGEHSLTIAYTKDGAKIDKINISDFLYAPGDIGEEAEYTCDPVYTGLEINSNETLYTLNQNYPNPFNQKTSISFEIPNSTFVSLKVFNVLGVEIAELCGTEYRSGKHTIEFDAEQLSDGNYFYRIKTDNFSAIRRMILL